MSKRHNISPQERASLFKYRKIEIVQEFKTNCGWPSYKNQMPTYTSFQEACYSVTWSNVYQILCKIHLGTYIILYFLQISKLLLFVSHINHTCWKSIPSMPWKSFNLILFHIKLPGVSLFQENYHFFRKSFLCQILPMQM